MKNFTFILHFSALFDVLEKKMCYRAYIDDGGNPLFKNFLHISGILKWINHISKKNILYLLKEWSAVSTPLTA